MTDLTAMTATPPTPATMDPQHPKVLSGSREAMEPLYERLLAKSFNDSASAVEFCRSLCSEFGFTVKQEASANKHIYVYCSREGLPDSQRRPRPSPQRRRPSKRCNCRWRVVLSETDSGQWEFRRFLNPNASEHNHEMMSPDEMMHNWPNEVNDLIIQLAQQRIQTSEIRDTVKQQYPHISWNERRFYNRLTEERKRIRQRDVLERSRRLTLLSAQLCSIVTMHDTWAMHVESEMMRLFDHYRRLARVQDSDTLVDLVPEAIQISNNLQDEQHHVKKRRVSASSLSSTTPTPPLSTTSSPPQAFRSGQPVHVPSYTLYVRPQPHRASPHTTRHHHHQQQQQTDPLPPLPRQQQQQQQQQQRHQQQPFISSPVISSPSASSFQQYQSPTIQQQQQQVPPPSTHDLLMVQQQRSHIASATPPDTTYTLSPYSVQPFGFDWDPTRAATEAKLFGYQVPLQQHQQIIQSNHPAMMPHHPTLATTTSTAVTSTTHHHSHHHPMPDDSSQPPQWAV
ncbi:hypothetical protein K492DRAFT_233113 [Lichtheimia hyalospora FSU 10163]|nr:hypothetical protein K492DRAFT_233113 [Lichtheimia hyalospora FSU 10163]